MPAPTRRALLSGLAAASALGLSGKGLGAVGRDHKFIMYWATGGWDVTKLFVPPDTLRNCDPEAGWSEREAHGIRFVDHGWRPRVRRFLQAYGDVTCLVNGMLIRSVNHRICARMLLTGSSTAGVPDWPSIIGADAATRHALPSVVVSGQTSAGPLSRHTNLVGTRGQLQELLDRRIFDWVEGAPEPPPDDVLADVDALLADRVARRLAASDVRPEAHMLEVMDNSLRSLDLLGTQGAGIVFDGRTLEGQIRTAVALLRDGVSRCATVGDGSFALDYHADVDDQNGPLNQLFGGLELLVELLRSTPGSNGGTLADQTTVVVASEMARTPWRNLKNGRDHWPYTSLLLIGAGIAGGRQIGGYNDVMDGMETDLVSGAPRPGGVVLTPSNLGATLLTLAGIDPEDWVPGFSPIHAALSA